MSRRKLIFISSFLAAALLCALVFLLFNNLSEKFNSEIIYTLKLSSDELEITDKNISPVITAKLEPKNSKAVLDYSSSNDSIIKFDESGVVTAVKSGIAAAVVKTVINGKEYQAMCTVIVNLVDDLQDDGMGEVEDPGPPVPAIPAPVIDDEGFL